MSETPTVSVRMTVEGVLPLEMFMRAHEADMAMKVRGHMRTVERFITLVKTYEAEFGPCWRCEGMGV